MSEESTWLDSPGTEASIDAAVILSRRLGPPIDTPGTREAGASDALRTLLRTSIPLRFAADRILFSEEDPVTGAYLVERGTVRLTKFLPDGRRHVLDFMLPGQLVGLTWTERHGYAAEAVGEVSVRKFPTAALERVMHDYPSLNRWAMCVTGDFAASALGHSLTLGCLRSDERVAAFLDWAAKRFSNADGSVEIPMDRADIADHLGLTTETVSRAIAQLRAAGIIQMASARRFRVLDRVALTHRAAGAPARP